MANINPYKVNKLVPLNDTIIVSEMHFGERITAGGILLRNDDTKSVGIRPRWGKVYA
jgi:co-chaperonin GroES (HSP10)